MGRKISDYNGGVQAVDSTYPYGQIKDNPGGTTIDVTSNGDIQQFFQRAAALSGVALNDIEDNFDNGWQYLDSVAGGINSYCVRLVRAMIGSAYDASTWYVIAGTATSAAEGWLFFDDNIYHIGVGPGVICGGGQVLVGTILPVRSNTWYKEVNLACGASGSGDFDYTDLVRFTSPISGTITYSGTYIAHPTLPITAKRFNGTVRVEGRTNNSVPVTSNLNSEVLTLPVGFRPAKQLYRTNISLDASALGSPVRIDTDGTVHILGTVNGFNNIQSVFGFDFSVE